MIGAFGCATSEMDAGAPVTAEPGGAASAALSFKRATAAQLSEVLSDATTRDRVIDQLRRRGPVALGELTALTGVSEVELGGDAVPEVWLREPAGAQASTDLLVAYAPAGNRHTWTEIPAYTLGGARVTLDAHHAPDVPVLVIETHGRLAMRKGIDGANLALQRAGLQAPAAPSAASIPTTRLDAIRLQDDKEPWISGAAEIYAVVSGVVGSDNNPQLRIVDMPYLDSDGITYTPNQIIVDWSGFAFQVANIQLFEHDDNTSYQNLVMVLVSAVGAVGSLAGVPTLTAITEIANRIIAALPASIFTNDDDYVDSFYTIEQTRSYTNLVGASRNATVSMQPFLVAPN
jgi:hypothetical protein